MRDKQAFQIETSKKRCSIAKIIITCISVIILLLAVGYGLLIFILTHDTEYTWFTKKRTAKMEDKFSISITDNIQLERYTEIEFLAQLDYNLHISTDDYQKFIDDNIIGEVTDMKKNDSGNIDISFKYTGESNQTVFVTISYSNYDNNYQISLDIHE